MRYEIKRIDVWSVVKIVFLLSLVGGFLFGVFYAVLIGFIGSVMGPMAGDEFSDALGLFRGVALIFIVFFFTIFIAVMYTVLAAIGAALYNFLARWAGGFAIELNSGEDKIQSTTHSSEEAVL